MRITRNELYQQHFQLQFGKPFDVQVYHDKDGFALKLATHDWARFYHSPVIGVSSAAAHALPSHESASSGSRVYASVGVADILARNEEEEIGEVVLSVDVADPDVPSLFVNALFFILHHDIPLNSRFSIGGVEQLQPEFFQRYRKSALYFTLANNEGDDPAHLIRNGELIGRVYQAYFITSEEDAFLEDYGGDAFEKEFRELGPERNMLRRPPCVE